MLVMEVCCIGGVFERGDFTDALRERKVPVTGEGLKDNSGDKLGLRTKKERGGKEKRRGGRVGKGKRF